MQEHNVVGSGYILGLCGNASLRQVKTLNVVLIYFTRLP